MLPQLILPPVSSKPWIVIATKADLPETQENFLKLRSYVEDLNDSKVDHPSRRQNAKSQGACALPISAINGEGVEKVIDVIVEMLGDA
jgi:GTPase